MTLLCWVGVLLFGVAPALLVAEVLRCLYLEHRRDRVPILLYHRLISGEAARTGRVRDDEPIYACYDDVFAEQMRHLHEAGYTTLSMDDYLAMRSGRARRPDKPVVLTFDDGYESNYTMAFPSLRRFGQKATIYVAPEPDEHTRRLVAGIDGFLSPQQMRELDAGGVAIESHTLTHCILSELPDDAARFELEESMRRLSESIGRPIRHLAVPRAGYSRRIRRLAQAAGYQTVCCNNKGSSTGWSDPMALPRIVVERDMTVEDFARLLRPRAAIALRLIGNIKRIPERLLGPSAARRIRVWLYNGPLGGLFVTRRLKVAVAAAAALYAMGCAVFYWRMLAA